MSSLPHCPEARPPAGAPPAPARVSIPDSAAGAGLDGSLGISVNGAAAGTLPVTSRYGWYYGSYPFTNDPGAGRQHHCNRVLDQAADGLNLHDGVTNSTVTDNFEVMVVDSFAEPRGRVG